MPHKHGRSSCHPTSAFEAFWSEQPHLESIDDLARDLVLDGEDVLKRPVVGLRPEVRAVGRTDQLRGDTDAVTRLADAPLEDVIDPERLRDVRDRHVLTFECERRSAGDHAQTLHLREHVEQLLAETVREIVVRLVVAHVDEGQHGDRRGSGACPRRRDRRGRRRRARLDSPAGGAFAVRVAVECEHADCNDQQGSDHHVELARGRVSDGLVAIDLVLAFQSFRGQLVDPGEDQRERKAEHRAARARGAMSSRAASGRQTEAG